MKLTKISPQKIVLKKLLPREVNHGISVLNQAWKWREVRSREKERERSAEKEREKEREREREKEREREREKERERERERERDGSDITIVALKVVIISYFPFSGLLTVGHLSPSPIGNLDPVDDRGSTGEGASSATLFRGWSGGVSG